MNEQLEQLTQLRAEFDVLANAVFSMFAENTTGGSGRRLKEFEHSLTRTYYKSKNEQISVSERFEPYCNILKKVAQKSIIAEGSLEIIDADAKPQSREDFVKSFGPGYNAAEIWRHVDGGLRNAETGIQLSPAEFESYKQNAKEVFFIFENA